VAKKECSRGHIYDTTIYGEDCPFCAAQNGGEKTVVSGNDDTRECPYCAETIKKNAKICRFCGKDLTSANAATQKIQGKKGKGFAVTGLIFSVLCFAFLVFTIILVRLRRG
jgi:hypothetical protein